MEVGDQFGEILDRAGAEGWEMVGISHTQYGTYTCFKRPAATAPTSTLSNPPPGHEVPPQSAPAPVVPESE
jgi:hypothetical protein